MIELPEAVVISNQINQTLSGKRIQRATANHTPHKFAWFSGDPARYGDLLTGKAIGRAWARSCNIEIEAGERILVLGTSLRFHLVGDPFPSRHQLLLEFDDSTALSAAIQMWGNLLYIPAGEDGGSIEMKFALIRPSPLTPAFDRAYFDSLFDESTPKLAAKAFLATGQRIPGLGNGVIQDILWAAHIHPRRKMSSLDSSMLNDLFSALKSVLQSMVDHGGRDTERDLFGCLGGYRTVMCKNTAGAPCPVCSSAIQKEAFMGGSIYFCPTCQPLG